MLNRLESYSAKQCEVFLANYHLTISSFNTDAIHDLRVAVKRIRAVFMLLERMFPGRFNAKETEEDLRELFRLSGRMRDAQVQQQLVLAYSHNTGISFTGYQNYLINTEKKAIGKFTKYLKGYHAGTDLDNIRKRIHVLLMDTDDETIKQHINLLVDELLATTRIMHEEQEQEQDEHLHAIRRKLKQCHNLLSVLKKDDIALPELRATLKSLDSVNNLLGDWHDRLVAMETLEKYISKQKKKGTAGQNRYRLFSETLADERRHFHREILDFFEHQLP